jgi:hypothetical protein
VVDLRANAGQAHAVSDRNLDDAVVPMTSTCGPSGRMGRRSTAPSSVRRPPKQAESSLVGRKGRIG